MDRERLDNWCEKGILGLILGILVFGPLSAGAVRPIEFLVLQWLAIGAATLWIFRLWIRRSHRLLWAPICWPIIAFVGYAIVRYSQAEIEYVARGELIRIVLYAFLFFVILDNLNRQESTQRISFVLIFLAMVISIYAIYEFITNSSIVWHLLEPERKPDQYLKRGTGTYICPNNLAGFLEMILPLGLAYVLAGRFKPTVKVFVAYAAIVMMAGIGISFSRGGWLAAGLSLLVFFVVLFCWRISRLPAFVLVVLLLGAGGFFFKSYQPQHRWRQMFRESGVVDDIRFHLWNPAVQIWRKHYWWGGGPAHFDYRFPSVRPAEVQLRAGYAHNDYLNTLADWGVVGAALVTSAWLLLYWGVLRSWKFVCRSNDLGSKPSNRSAFVLGSAIGLFALLLHSIVDFNMQIPANAIVVVALMAMLTGHLRFATERYWVAPGWTIRIGLTIVGLIGLAFLGQQGFKRLREQALLDRAERIHTQVQKRSKELSDVYAAAEIDLERTFQLSKEINKGVQEEIEILKRAHALEPKNFATTYKIGEAFRNVSWAGGDDYREFAQEAAKWFRIGIELNPLDAYNYARLGMCLDWLGEHAAAGPFYQRAAGLDPKSFFVTALCGWHFFSAGDYGVAKQWFDKSIQLSGPWLDNVIAHSYTNIIGKKLREKATSP